MKAYVILQKGFEYNDEVYSENDGGGGNPQIICFSKEDAKAKVEQLNFDQYKRKSLQDYTKKLHKNHNLITLTLVMAMLKM